MAQEARWWRRFYWARVAVLFSLFLMVSGWALWDMKQRRERNTWQRPLNIALVVMRIGPVSDIAAQRLKDRVDALQEQLHSEFRRWHGGEQSPFAFTVYGPIDVKDPPPSSQGEGLWQLATFAYEQWRYLRVVDNKAGVPHFTMDSRIYLVARPANDGELQFVEGQSQQGGRVGVVEVQLSDLMVDFALFVATHELFHTLDASDKYDEFGRSRMPDGLAEPEKIPVFPQRYVEIMARGRPIDTENEEPPGSLEQLRVGAATAREIGWIK